MVARARGRSPRRPKISAQARGKAADFEAVAAQVVADLKAQGAEALLAEVLAQTSK